MDQDSAARKRSSTRLDAWTSALVVISIVAGGIAAVGMVTRASTPPTPPTSAAAMTATTAPAQTTSTEPPADPLYVTPTVAFPTRIPGCNVVEPPSDDATASWVIVGDEDSYDNPRYPWFSGPKATAMSEALRGALPDDVELEYSSPDNSLVFAPIPDYESTSGLPHDLDPDSLGGWTTAHGRLIRGEDSGDVYFNVRRGDSPPPPCVAGELVERRTQPDGSVIDVQDTWSESNGTRTLRRGASAYLPDGTHASATVSNSRPDGGAAGAIPVSLDELVALVTAPGLRVTAPVPPGTAAPITSCSGGMQENEGTRLTRKTIERLDRALDEHWSADAPPGWVLAAPIGSLQLTNSRAIEACAAVEVTGPDGAGRLEISLQGGQQAPVAVDEYDPANEWSRAEVLIREDGTVVEQEGYGADRIVTVTRPSGTRVRVHTTFPASYDVLESIGTATGLEVN
ncbi:hypothetical protein ERC79_18165 [Rhodococcus sp. ABRD24]|uniref:hypothetical protein n=1 Tax=Rhodococcus sp. ABRD24 TaxID=2507582 RepID=UPI001039E5F6|nr:hypothetical protein [Rhodococcus sp. ABRD24]QBJ97647.1 hypothetical protein ERC79_18165 [Rhodococcus sp. ABRD24]